MAADPNQPPTNCPQCGAPATADQEYCLECGTRLTRAVAPARAWRWPLVIVGVILVLAGAGLAVAYDKLAKEDKKEKGAAAGTTQTPTFTAPPTTAPPTTTGGTTTGAPLPPGSDGGSTTGGGLPKLPIPIPGLGGGDDDGGGGGGGGGAPPGGTGQPSTGVASWPSGKSAWTVVLYSAGSKADGQAKAQSAAQKTSGVGLLNSSDFSSLNPGYWVVFAGQSGSKSAAESKADSLQGQGFPQAYARFVKPK